MDPTEFFHFLHVAVFAVILGIEVPCWYALNMTATAAFDSNERIFALRIRRATDTLSAILIILMLPLGLHIAIDIGVYTLKSPGWLISTWIVSAAWLVLALAAYGPGNSVAARRLYFVEAVFRVIVGLGNIYDAIVGFLGSGMIQTNWLAAKVLLFGLILVVSGVLRWPLRNIRFFTTPGTDSLAHPPSSDEQAALSAKVAWGYGLIFAMVLAAAWLGINKPW